MAVKVPDCAKEGWQGGELGAGVAARARPGRHGRWPARSKQSNEVLHPHVRLPQNGPQCAPAQFSMRGDDGLNPKHSLLTARHRPSSIARCLANRKTISNSTSGGEEINVNRWKRKSRACSKGSGASTG
jgi:hypothetical protein